MTPSRMALEPDRPFSQSVSQVVAAAIGLPTTKIMNRPTTMIDTSGMTTTGMTPRTPFGTLQPGHAVGDAAGGEAGDQAAEEAGAEHAGEQAADDAGDQAGPVGDARRR